MTHSIPGEVSDLWRPVSEDDRTDPSALQAEFNQAMSLAVRIRNAAEVRVVSRRLFILVDTYGIYNGVLDWMAMRDIAADGPDIIADYAGELIGQLAHRLETREGPEFPRGGLGFNTLLGHCLRRDIEALGAVRQINEMQFSLELFYAPVPFDRIRYQMRRRYRQSGHPDLKRQMDKLDRKVIELPFAGARDRDYRHYDDFVRALNERYPGRTEQGFYNFFVRDNGLGQFDEKEVDVRLTMRAMELLSGDMADALCIVSSDQDFGPLHDRIRDAGLRSYHADLARFADEGRIGRHLRGQLGDDLIRMGDLAADMEQRQALSGALFGQAGRG